MYMPGRSRTGSRPSRTVMSFALYAASVIKKSPANLAFPGALKVYQTRRPSGRPREARRGRFCNDFAKTFILDSRRPARPPARAPPAVGSRRRSRSPGIVLRGALRKLPGANRKPAGAASPRASREALEQLRLELRELECPRRRRGRDVQLSVAGRSAPATRCARSARPRRSGHARTISVIPSAGPKRESSRWTSSPIRSGFTRAPRDDLDELARLERQEPTRRSP